MYWRISYWWRHERPTLYRRCVECRRLETVLWWRVGMHADCLPF
jgi:hypothetical protein